MLQDIVKLKSSIDDRINVSSYVNDTLKIMLIEELWIKKKKFIFATRTSLKASELNTLSNWFKDNSFKKWIEQLVFWIFWTMDSLNWISIDSNNIAIEFETNSIENAELIWSEIMINIEILLRKNKNFKKLSCDKLWIRLFSDAIVLEDKWWKIDNKINSFLEESTIDFKKVK